MIKSLNFSWPLAIFLLIGANVAIFLLARLYPFVDLPNHLAVATIYKHIGDHRLFARYFTVRPVFPEANVLHLVFTASSLFPSVEFANRFFYLAYLVAFPASMLLLIRACGGNQQFAILGFLLLYNLSVYLGFVGSTIAEPLVLLFLYFILRPLPNTAASILLLAALLVLLFMAHALAFLFAAALFVLCCLVRICPVGKLLALIPGFGVLILWWRSRPPAAGSGTLHFLVNYYSHEYWVTLKPRLGFLLLDNYSLFDGVAGYAIALAVSALILAPVVLKWRQALQLLAFHRGIAVLAALSLACCLFLPGRLPDQPVLYERFSVFLLIAFILWGALLWQPRQTTLLIFFCIACLYIGLWAQYFYEFNQENKGFNAAFLAACTGRTYGLIYDYTYRGRPLYNHFPSYHIVWNSGIAGTRSIDYAFGTVRRKAGFAELPAYDEWVGKFRNYQRQYVDMDFLLVRGQPPWEWYGTPEAGSFSYLRQADKWRILQRPQLKTDR